MAFGDVERTRGDSVSSGSGARVLWVRWPYSHQPGSLHVPRYWLGRGNPMLPMELDSS